MLFRSGLNIATVRVVNNGTEKAWFFLDWNGITLEYQLEASMELELSLAAGEYDFWVEDSEGNEKLDDDFLISNTLTLAIGWTAATIESPEKEEIDLVSYIATVAVMIGITAIIMVVITKISPGKNTKSNNAKSKTSKSKSTVWKRGKSFTVLNR